MRAQLVALAFVERAFQQGAEDGRFHLAPVMAGGFDQQAQLQGVQRQGSGVLEQKAVELLQLDQQGFGFLAFVHGAEQARQNGIGHVRRAAQFVQQGRKAAMRDQIDVFGEHGEQAAHQEAGDILGLVALTFKAAAKRRQVARHFARDPGGDLGRVQAVGIGPDGVQAGAHGIVGQILQPDAVTVAVGKLGVALTLAREIGVNLNHMADIDDQQEGRPAIGARNGTGIAIGLIAGTQHGVIPAGTAPLAVALPLFGTIGQQEKLVIVGGRAMDALFGLHDERPTPIEIDKAARLGACVDEGDGALKTVVIALGISRCRFGRIDAQKLGQFDGELLEVGPLGPARCFPTRDEIVNDQWTAFGESAQTYSWRFRRLRATAGCFRRGLDGCRTSSAST